MPGILPMKVIKVGTNAQSRIAQACDRCRSKKIRCDGIRPCCTQCANVGFECKTSDKLSRRAFPRGYTESLEERVRQLETELRELKDLLDEKDEKIDMLSRIHSRSSKPLQLHSPGSSPSLSTSSRNSTDCKEPIPVKDDLITVQQSPHLTDDDRSDSYFSGTSSTRTFIETFKDRVRETGEPNPNIDTTLLLSVAVPTAASAVPVPSSMPCSKAPPRLVADQLVNIFFQEWAPLFPVLHRPTFLALYERYTNDLETVTDHTEIAQLNLVFGIAALSSGSKVHADVRSLESQWKAAMSEVIAQSSMASLQVLVLAQLYCIQQGDSMLLLTYKGLSTSLSARLGLHQSQKRFALGTLTCETRKKVFWTLFTLDGFTSVMLGLPKHLKDEDVHCEYPVDADDEYVSENGFQPSLPGEMTRLSGALALFRAARVLSKVLEEVYPAKPTYELSLKKLASLSDELDVWYNSLPPHLRLQFAMDKPSTSVTGSRSPILSLVYHYIRTLIERPAISASSGTRSDSSMLAMATSCKHIVQIMQLLDERGLSFSFCLNRVEVLVVSGLGLLFQALNLGMQSRILRDNSKTLASIVEMLHQTGAPCAAAFRSLAQEYMDTGVRNEMKTSAFSRHNSEGTATAEFQSSTRKNLKAIASRLSSGIISRSTDVDGSRRASSNSVSPQSGRVPLQNRSSLHFPAPSHSPSEPAESPISISSRPYSVAAVPSARQMSLKSQRSSLPNLDYLSFSTENYQRSISQTGTPIKPETQPSDWEKLLGNLDNGDTNIFDACYGGPPIDVLLGVPPLRPDAPFPDLHTLDHSAAWAVDQNDVSADPSASILSFSTDEGLSSVEDFATEWNSGESVHEEESFLHMAIPDFMPSDDVSLETTLTMV